MPPTGPKPFPPSKKIQKLDRELKPGEVRFEDGSIGKKPRRRQVHGKDMRKPKPYPGGGVPGMMKRG